MFILFMGRSFTAKMCFYLPTDDIYPLYGKKHFHKSIWADTFLFLDTFSSWFTQIPIYKYK